MKKFPPEKRAEIVAALRLNPNAAAVAKQIGGVSRETVGAVAREARIVLAKANPAKRKRLSPETRAQIVAALEALPNATQVARRIGGVSSRTIQKIAEKAGIKLQLPSGDQHWTRAKAKSAAEPPMGPA